MTAEPFTSPALAAAPPARPASSAVPRAGSITYSPGGLRTLFAWLLAADFVYMLINQIEPVALPLLLKGDAATDRQITLLVVTVPAVLNLVVNPVVSYRSDRTRSRWGRRIPYLAVATPLVSLFLALTPFAPEIARGRFSLIGTFAVLIACYQLFQVVVQGVYFYLLRDVVPMDLMGRFLSLLRIASALSIAALNYCLLPWFETHPKRVFAGVAGINLIAFGMLCLRVREGAYPEVPDKAAGQGAGFAKPLVTFVLESLTHPIYGWTYAVRSLVYATMPLSGFVVLFGAEDLHLDLKRVGHILAWPSLAWIVAAYPVGVLLDRWGTMRVLQVSLAGAATAYLAAFLLAHTAASFAATIFIGGLAYWAVMLAQVMLAQVIFHPGRMGQLSAANSIVQSIVIAFGTGPLAAWLLGSFPHAALGHYRIILLLIAAIYAAALVSLIQVRRHWERLGGAAAYAPPL